MKKRKIVKSVALLLFFSILLSGCAKGKFADRTISPKSKELDWAIAGIWSYETEDAVPEEKIAELNQMLAEKGKKYQIKFHFIEFKDGQISKENKEALIKSDLITIANQIAGLDNMTDDIKYYPTLLECTDNNIFEPLDKYMNTENGMKIKERMLSNVTLEQGYWDGKQWLLPTGLPVMSGPSLRFEGNFYEKSGIEADTVPDFTECDELFEKIYQANGRQPFLTFSDRKKEGRINNIPTELPHYLKEMLDGGARFYWSDVLGVGSLKTTGNDLDTRNLLKEPYFEEYLNAWRRYIEKGYVKSNMDSEVLVELSDSYKPEVNILEFDGGRLITPKSQNYMLKIDKELATIDPFTGIGMESEQKELAFEALADLIVDKELNEIIHSFANSTLSEFVFHIGLSEEGEKEYKKLVETIPRFTHAHTFDTFSTPEIEEINKVYAEYSTEEYDDGTQKVLERHFSKDGKVTEESIHEGIQRLNEKLDAAGMEKFIEALKEEKIKSER